MGDTLPRWVTGSRRLDYGLFFLILFLIFFFSWWRLRVYYQVIVAEVTVEEIAPGGGRRALPTPSEFDHPGNGYWPGESLLPRLSPKIQAYMNGSEWAQRAEPGTRFEWTIRWANNSTRLDHVDRLVWEVPNATRL